MDKDDFVSEVKDIKKIQKINDQIPKEYFSQTLLDQKTAIIKNKWIWMLSLVIAPILTSVLTYPRYASNKYPGYLDFFLFSIFMPLLSPELSLVKANIELWVLFSVVKSIIGVLVMALFMRIIRSSLFMKLAFSILALIIITMISSFGEIVIA